MDGGLSSGDSRMRRARRSLLEAEVFLSEKKTPAEVLKDIGKATYDLPSYKRVSKVVIRDEEFDKTTSRKIKR